MVLKSDQERVMSLLKDTITLLCKNGLNFKSKFCVDAVIGVTVDEDELFYISVKEVVKSDKAESEANSRLSNGEGSAEEGLKTEDAIHKRRRRKRRLKTEGNTSDADSSKQLDSGDEGGSSPRNEATEAGEQSPDQSSSKRACVKNEEEDSDEDIMFIKQELDDNNSWSQSQEMSGIAGDSSYQSFSGMPSASQQDQNFPSLSDMTLTPVDAGEGPSGGWGMSQQQQRQYMGRSPRTPTSLSTSQLQSQPGDLDPQQQKHPFSCSVCHKGFATRGSMKRHWNTHSGIFPHNCSYCGKGFLSPDGLRGHIFIHTGIKEFSCDRCGSEYQYEKGRRDHYPKCTGKKNIP